MTTPETAPETTNSENPFWDFSLLVYFRPGVAEACLALQDRCGLDVNLLLFCCWVGAQGRRLDAAELARLMDRAGPWQREVVGPLRAVRRRLKEAPGDVAAMAAGRVDALRRAVKDCELAAERVEQDSLYAVLAGEVPSVDSTAEPAACAAANLIAYLEAAGAAIGGEDRSDLISLLGGAFEDLAPDAAKDLLNR